MANVMIVDSGLDWIENWPAYLSENGHLVRMVESNSEALRSLDFHPDLILCGNRPSRGVDFNGLARALKTEDVYKPFRFVPIIGFGVQNYFPDEGGLYVAAYLQTPASPHRLIEEVERRITETT